MPETAPPLAVTRPRGAVAYWVGAVILYAVLGSFFQPLFLLGFWESLPFLFLVTLLAGRLFPRPIPPLPPGPTE